jgi:hypothetical protein
MYAKIKVNFNFNFAEGCLVASYFFLRRQEKATKKKATPVCRRHSAALRGGKA